MKKALFLVLTILMVFALTGTGFCVDDGVFKVALLVPSSINDDGWNNSAYQGLKLIEKELGAEISYVEAPTPSEMKESFRDYAERGYDLVFGHGFQFQDAALEVAREYPETIFVTIGGANTAENLAPVVIKGEDGFYLAGVISAVISKTGKAGLIGGMDIPAVSKTFRGFKLGAQSVNPDFEVMITYVGSWEDVNAGYEAALSQINKGADIIIPNGNAVGLGSIKAADERGVYSFGYINDQVELAPETMVASIMLDVPKAYLAVAEKVKEGTFECGKIQEVGLIEEVTYIKWNEKIKGQFSEEVFQKLQEAIDKIVSGEYRVPGELE